MAWGGRGREKSWGKGWFGICDNSHSQDCKPVENQLLCLKHRSNVTKQTERIRWENRDWFCGTVSACSICQPICEPHHYISYRIASYRSYIIPHNIIIYHIASHHIIVISYHIASYHVTYSVRGYSSRAEEWWEDMSDEKREKERRGYESHRKNSLRRNNRQHIGITRIHIHTYTHIAVWQWWRKWEEKAIQCVRNDKVKDCGKYPSLGLYEMQ